MSSASDSDSWETASDDDEEKEEEGDDSGDLSHLGAAVTSVKFQTVQQRSFHVTERGSEMLAQQVLESCQSSGLDLVPSSGHPAMEQSRDNPREGTRVLQQNFIQVQQQFGDVMVQGTRNLTIGGTQNIGKSSPSQDEDEKALKKADKILKRTLSKIDEWTRGMVKTSALEKVLEKFNKGTSWVTIKGSPGEGKSTVAFMALGEIHKLGRQVFHVTSPKEYSEVTAASSLPVVMLDDIFGNLEFDHTKWILWEVVLHDVLDTKEHRSHEKHPINTVTVILVGRENVLNTASCNMGRMADFFTQGEHVVDMSHRVDRNVKEKLAIWNAISDSSGNELDLKTIDRICNINGPHGFPHVCRLFLTLGKKYPQITAEDFFEKPLEFLNQTVLTFMKNKLKLILFKELLKRDGKASVHELGKLDNGSETIQTAYDLVGTYLKTEEEYFVFDHPSIYDSAAYNIGKLYPLFVIENCNLSFIHERLRLQSSRDTQHPTPSRESELAVHIPRSYRKNLAKRFADEITDLNILQVFSHQSFRDEVFVKDVMDLLVPLTELIQLDDKNSEEKFLSLLASNKSPQLLKYVNNNIGRQLTKDEINAVLYGVCKYAASDVLSYLKQICDSLDINVTYGEWKQTPLMIGAETRVSQFVQDILSLNPDVNQGDDYGTKAFHYFCENGLVLAVTQLIERGADLDEKDECERTPLWYAGSRNQIEVARLLLNKGATTDLVALKGACEGESVDILNMLFERGAKVDGEVLKEACQGKSVELVNLMFERGATVNMTSKLGETPLYSACYYNGSMNVISYLIEKGASVTSKSYGLWSSPLHRACNYNKSQVVQYLLDQGADLNGTDSSGDTPLHAAADWGSEECVDVLLKAGADVNAKNKYGFTPLHKASAFADCVDMLLKAGADVNVRSKDGDTPLHKAVEKRSPECVDVLLTAGADVNLQSTVGQISLHKSLFSIAHCMDSPIYLPDIFICQTLISHGAVVNKQDADGNTPLHQLCRVDSDTIVYQDSPRKPASSYEDVYRNLVILLVDHGADVNIYNNRGETALHGWCQTVIRKKDLAKFKEEEKSCTIC